ncbi:hypothetical protein CFN78_14130 [Amycolatopsis antarctica]|uniref:ABC transporter permease n=1 Tax=Amycolatopsis antarctica TaxID=1854586 RepID=A0A263D317_9PSEU|nr:ABC transporter permease [Amycolatopsis antarctica]OZM72751.1 hypothetical protein CFN78_14130 [Amycolatopsis antarctica]
MTLLAVERIKLFSTRSPWWCALIAVVVTVGLSALVAGTIDDPGGISVGSTQFGYNFGMPVVMVLAALAVTTEYRFGTMRTTFQAIPNRAAALGAKAVVVALVGLVIGLVSAFGSLAVSQLLQPDADLSLSSAAEWTNVAGIGPVYALAAVLAIGVGVLLRHSAGAIALLMIYTLAVESLMPIIPKIGDSIYQWMPFNVVNKFITGDNPPQAGPPASTSTLSPTMALIYFAAWAVAVFAIAIVVTKRRDA